MLKPPQSGCRASTPDVLLAFDYVFDFKKTDNDFISSGLTRLTSGMTLAVVILLIWLSALLRSWWESLYSHCCWHRRFSYILHAFKMAQPKAFIVFALQKVHCYYGSLLSWMSSSDGLAQEGMKLFDTGIIPEVVTYNKALVKGFCHAAGALVIERE
ncbi:unnamed protein product [Lactuca saligna]|uniref:Uncharacterized protein n=1 Tax=Lactuca saligna TaxID=75948 RepID=A0AA36EER8_LACSI|nr:unnamed protein product [Lactuca saligna]